MLTAKTIGDGRAPEDYVPPLSIFFAWHPLDKSICNPVFEECFSSLRRDVNRPFSRSVNVPVFVKTSPDGQIPSAIDVQSKRAIVFAFVGKNCISDDKWIIYLQQVANNESADIVPIALDKTAYNLPGGLDRKNFIRAYEFDHDAFNDRTCIAIFHEIYRFGLNELCKKLPHGKDSALKLFLSHAKDGAQGVAVAKALKQLIENGPMREFFDATDIAVGFEFEPEILGHIADSMLVAIHSDSYSSRYWCQREIVASKDRDRPIIAVDVVGKFEDRRFPLAANLPAIRVPVGSDFEIKQTDLLSIVKAALLETIRFFYAKQILAEYQAAGWFPASAFLSARPPEACVLARISALSQDKESGHSEFVYPDPPIYQEESIHFGKFGLNAYTPLTSLRLNLSSKRIGISISEPDTMELLKLGQTTQHLNLLLQDVARYILSYGAELVYGGDLRPGGFTDFLFQEGHALMARLKSTKVHLTNHIAWPVHIRDKQEVRDWKATHRKVATMVEHVLPEDVRDLVASTDDLEKLREDIAGFVWSRSLTEMRKGLIRDSGIRISAGGRLAGYKGCMPGVLEEIAVAVEMKKPIFLVGGFGGVTRSVSRLITTKVVPLELTYPSQVSNNPKFGEIAKFAASRGYNYQLDYQRAIDRVANADLRNGLTPDENARLFETPFVDEVIHLLLKGINKI